MGMNREIIGKTYPLKTITRYVNQIRACNYNRLGNFRAIALPFYTEAYYMQN